MNADLHAFVRDALARGVAPEALRAALRDARWPDDEIESELAAWHDAGLGLPVPRRRVGVSPREAFLYLLLFVALYLVAYHTGAILFAWIDRRWPDVAMGDPYGYADRNRDFVRFAVASLLVAFPVYLLTARITSRAVARDPEKRNSGVRRWLTYLTLFNAACVLIGDFIVVLLGFMKGELTVRFGLKAAVVACIAGWLFTHYMGGLKRDEDDVPAAGRRTTSPWLARAAAIAVVGVTALGMGMVGAPETARREALDQIRLQHLDAISNAVQVHASNFAVPPADLTELAQRSPGTRLTLADPVSHEPYAYTVLDSTSYELCATFDRPDSLGPWDRGGTLPFWRHGAGRACFTFRLPVTTRGRALPR